MASAYKDYIRDEEGEIAGVLKDNLSLVREDLIITGTGIEFTEDAKDRLAIIARDRAEALKAGLPFKEPVHKDRVASTKSEAKAKAQAIEEDAEAVREAEERNEKAEAKEEKTAKKEAKVSSGKGAVKAKEEEIVEEAPKEEVVPEEVPQG